MSGLCGRAPAYVLSLCPVEQKRWEAWGKKHIKECPVFLKHAYDPTCPPGLGAGSVWGLFIRENSFGYSAEIQCDCGARENISHWEHD